MVRMAVCVRVLAGQHRLVRASSAGGKRGGQRTAAQPVYCGRDRGGLCAADDVLCSGK